MIHRMTALSDGPRARGRSFWILSTALMLIATRSADGAGAEAAWPGFRGPAANPVGSSQRLPTRWSVRDNVEWKAEIPGRGWSSPIVVGKRVFLTTVTTDGPSKRPQTGTDFSNDYIAELTKQGLSDEQVMARLNDRDIELPHEVTLHYFLYCLDLETGAVRWAQEFHRGRPPGGRHRKNSFASETPVTDGQSVFVYVANLGLYPFSLDGQLRWMAALEAYPIYLDFGTGGSPVLHDNLLVIVNDNEREQFIAAFDKRNGRQVWRTKRDLAAGGEASRRSGWASPFIWRHPQRTEIVSTGPGATVSYDLTGKELWRIAGMSSSPIPSPFEYDGLLYVDGGAGGGLFAIRPGASGDISLKADQRSNQFVVWSDERAGTYLPTPVAYKGGIYRLSEKGILTRFDARTGKPTYRERLDREAGTFTSSPWAYNGKVFVLSEDGDTFVVQAGPEFKILGKNSLNEMTMATPAVVRGSLIIRTLGKLYRIARRTP